PPRKGRGRSQAAQTVSGAAHLSIGLMAGTGAALGDRSQFIRILRGGPLRRWWGSTSRRNLARCNGVPKDRFSPKTCGGAERSLDKDHCLFMPAMHGGLQNG